MVLAAIVLGLVGAATFAVSLGRLVSEPGRYGSNYSFSVGDNSGLTAQDLEALGGDPDVENLTILTAGQARAGDASVALIGIDHVEGNLAPHLLAGRLPAGPDEVALGRVTASELHLSVGDRLALDGSDGSSEYRVTGLAVLPTVGGNDGVGLGAALTPEGFARLQSDPDTALAAVVVRPGAPPDAGARIAGLVGQSAGQEIRPAPS